MKTIKNQTCGEEVGATMLEMALVIFLFLITILFFTDCARFFMTRALLIRGTQEAADLASRAPDFDIDTQLLTKASPESQRFRDARATLVSAAMAASSTNSVIAPSTANSWIKLRPFSVVDTYSDQEQTTSADILILRPGESNQWTPPSGGAAQWIHNPLRCSSAHATGGCTQRAGSDTMSTMMQSFPIMVQMQATVRTITPFVGPWTVQATMLSWREQPAKSGFREANGGAIPKTTVTPDPFTGSQDPTECETSCPGMTLDCSDPDCCTCVTSGGN